MQFFRHSQDIYWLQSLRRLAIGTLLVAFALQSSATLAQQTQQLYLAHTGGPGSLYQASATEFARRVNARLPAGFELVVVGESGLGDGVEILEKVKRGEVAMALPSTVMTAISDKFSVFELPFLIRDRSQVQAVSQPLLDRYLQPEARRNGYRILAIWENGFRHITNNLRPIRHPSDLAGLRLRIPKGPWREKVFKAIGAQTISVPLHETREAMAAGTLDGQENSLAQIKGLTFNEVQRYLTFSSHVYTPAYLVVGDEAFARLPPEVQQVLAAEATAMQGWVYATAVRLDSDLVDELAEIFQTNQLDMKAFRAVTRPLYGEFIRTVDDGAKMLELLTGMDENSQMR